MLNKEKYAKEIMDIALEHSSVAIVNSKPYCCEKIDSCQYCELNHGDCDKKFIEWSNLEYKETEIDWSKVPVDTPILVWDYDDKNPKKRHFAYFKDNNIYAWSDGLTSYTASEVTNWENAKIAKGVDCDEWYKD